jgi:hypothetical protein
MITIHIEEYINGFSIVGWDPKDGKFLNEIHEERIHVLKALEEWITSEIVKDFERREPYASTM